MRPKRNLRSNLGRFIRQIWETAAAAQHPLDIDYKWLLLSCCRRISAFVGIVDKIQARDVLSTNESAPSVGGALFFLVLWLSSRGHAVR